jgi:hypothetical protein
MIINWMSPTGEPTPPGGGGGKSIIVRIWRKIWKKRQ